MKGIEKLHDQLENTVLVHLRDPFVLRISVLVLIGLVGIGGIGTSLYLKLQTLYARYYEEQVRVVLIREHQSVKQTLLEYKERLSSNTEFIEWLRDMRDICRRMDLDVIALAPALTVPKDPEALRQLSIDLTVTGDFLNMLKLLGKFEHDRVRINVRSITLTPTETKAYLMRLKLGILMQPPSAKKAKDKTSQERKQAVAVAVSTTAVSAAISSRTATAAQNHEPSTATVRATQPVKPPAQKPAAAQVSTAATISPENPERKTTAPPTHTDKPTSAEPPSPSSKFGLNRSTAPLAPKIEAVPDARPPAASSKFSPRQEAVTEQAASSGTAAASKFLLPAPVAPPKAARGRRKPSLRKPSPSTPTAVDGKLLPLEAPTPKGGSSQTDAAP